MRAVSLLSAVVLDWKKTVDIEMLLPTQYSTDNLSKTEIY